MGYACVCSFCMSDIADDEMAVEFMSGDRLEHLDLACERCIHMVSKNVPFRPFHSKPSRN